MTAPHAPTALAIVAVVSAVASAVNSAAGGGTLLTFPALVAVGVPPLVANATSTVALSPGSLASVAGYRRDLRGAGAWAARFAVPSLAGGLVGALLLLRTPPDRFAAIVPWLVLGATMLFVAQQALTRRRLAADDGAPRDELPAATPALLGFQFLVGVYGGYFGAGIGILMLAALGFMGFADIHRMNGLKNWGGFCMNAVAAVAFAARGIVDWPVALTMAVGAAAGGWLGSGLARRVGPVAVRRFVVCIGLASGIWLLVSRAR